MKIWAVWAVRAVRKKSGFENSEQLLRVVFSTFCGPPPLLREQFLYPERGQKQTFLDPLPPHLVHVVIECPLDGIYFVDQKVEYLETLTQSSNCLGSRVKRRFLIHPTMYFVFEQVRQALAQHRIRPVGMTENMVEARCSNSQGLINVLLLFLPQSEG